MPSVDLGDDVHDDALDGARLDDDVHRKKSPPKATPSAGAAHSGQPGTSPALARLDLPGGRTMAATGER
ncbi:MAG: hypothetical protein NTX50_12840 [Candidatus Sumerlaeota bacterium]|nr:hypothetical protein [Candidatus Sumerlaeota bacterium]